MRILKNESLALVIDIQEKLFPHMADKEALLANTGILMEGLKALSVPFMLTEQYKKGLGTTIQELKNKMTNVETLEKSAFSCCDDIAFSEELKLRQKKNVIICGIEAHVCVLQTAIDLLGNGYQPVVIYDCVSSRKLLDKEMAIHRMRQEGVIVSSYESILFELARVSGTDEFKAISRLVK